MSFWIDTHCHLDAPEFGPQALTVRAQAAAKGVAHCVLPAVERGNFDAVRELAHAAGDSYALGIHPLYVKQAQDHDLQHLEAALAEHGGDPRLVAVGEIGLDYFVPELCQSPWRERQEHFFLAQLRLAHACKLPVILHTRRSVDRVLKALRTVAGSAASWRGIAHAFNGSEQQARAFIALGFKLGFGGALTYARALQLRRLATSLPLDAIVLETDAPDMPPHWLYTAVGQRALGVAQQRNEPGELPRIGAELAALRAIPTAALASASTRSALVALPRLRPLLPAALLSVD